MAPRMTKAELQDRLEDALRDADAHRLYAQALRTGAKPNAVIDVYLGHDDYTERWTLYFAERASGGVLVTEQFHDGDLCAWSVTLAMYKVVAEGDFYRRDALNKVHAAQRVALGLEGTEYSRVDVGGSNVDG